MEDAQAALDLVLGVLQGRIVIGNNVRCLTPRVGRRALSASRVPQAEDEAESVFERVRAHPVGGLQPRCIIAGPSGVARPHRTCATAVATETDAETVDAMLSSGEEGQREFSVSVLTAFDCPTEDLTPETVDASHPHSAGGALTLCGPPCRPPRSMRSWSGRLPTAPITTASQW